MASRHHQISIVVGGTAGITVAALRRIYLMLHPGPEAGGESGVHPAALPFECPGAPQKIVYLTADHLPRKGVSSALAICNISSTPR